MKDRMSVDIVNLSNRRMWTLKPDYRQELDASRYRECELQSCFVAVSPRAYLEAEVRNLQHEETNVAAASVTSVRVVRLRTRLHDEHETHSDLRAILFLVILVTVCCGLAGSIMHIW
jgi:hypothetical protein